ncbi:MAG: hypothetical protein JW888_15690 [Pirellulales bacterium]|nr:hypothetical protein [Pirellulales bacterium]
MGRFQFDHILNFLTSTELFLGLLWAGLAALSITLLVLIRTRWGQSRPLRKCLVLSLLAHLLLAGYATTVQIWSLGPRPGAEPTMRISLADNDVTPTDSRVAPPQDKPWEQFVDDDVAQPRVADAQRVPVAPAPDLQREPGTPRDTLFEEPDVDPTALPRPAELAPETSLLEPVEPHPQLGRQAEPLEAPKAQRRKPEPLPVPVDRQRVATSRETPERDAQGGLPSTTLAVPTPLPRVDEPSDTTDSAALLHGVTDLATPTPRGSPADATDDPTASQGESAASTFARMYPPSLPTLDERRTLNNGRSGLPGVKPNVEPGPPQLVLNRQRAVQHDIPKVYRLRRAPDRSRQAERRGATPESEAAVGAGLEWLAANQEFDGRWDADRHGAGRETKVAGHDRRGAGIRADTGMTGLALLAFLAAGHTQQQGIYQDNVCRGLDFLVAGQRPNGSLAGEATAFAAMYCHAMATFALSEAYAMTGDTRLERPVRRAIEYIVAAQDGHGGGWRYEPGQPGDTSQLGWQLMALKSAELAGIPMSTSTRTGILRFLASVSSGREGGLAAYRPGQPATRAMTAEAMVCRQFLGMPPGSPTAIEAADLLLGELPGEGPVNLYYWYYSTLGLYQIQGLHWDRWNQALQKDLVSRQRNSGETAGSWDPDTVWGSYGGRVYSTAMATLCLEVYYRYLPLYVDVETASNEKNLR